MQTILKLGGGLHHFFHHIFTHKEKIDFVDFVKLHYSDNAHHEEDQSEHENLPFQHQHNGQQMQVLQFPFLLPQPAYFTPFQVNDNFNNPLIFNHPIWHSTSFLDEIWQPPKA